MSGQNESKLIENISNLLKNRDFEKAEAILLSQVKPIHITRILHYITEQGAGMLSYAFVNYMIRKEDNAFWHRVAACIAAESLDHVTQGHNTGLYHILEAIHKSPQDWMLKEYALGFFEEGILEPELARQFAQDVLKQESHNTLAQKILNSLN